MKKHLSFILITAIFLSLTACGQGPAPEEEKPIEEKTEEAVWDCDVLGHEEGSWETTYTDCVKAEQHYEKKCPRCGKVIDEKTECMESLVEGNYIMLDPDQFCDRMDSVLGEYISSGLQTELIIQDNQPYYVIAGNGQKWAQLCLMNEKGEETAEELGKFKITSSIVNKMDFMGTYVAVLAQVLDPSLNSEEALELTRMIAESAGTDDPVKKNGLLYACVPYNEGYVFNTAVLKK